MTDEQKNKMRADMERSVDRMRDKLVEVCTIAADALKEMRETESLGDKWRKLSAAVGKVRSMMRPEPGADGTEPIDPNAPKMVRGWPDVFDLRELGIYWRHFYTPRYGLYVAAWNNGNDAHVYQMTVRPWPLASGERWHVNVTNDGGTVFTMEAKSKWLANICGLAAMRQYIIRGHRKTWRKVHGAAAAASGQQQEAPDTVARQMEE